MSSITPGTSCVPVFNLLLLRFTCLPDEESIDTLDKMAATRAQDSREKIEARAKISEPIVHLELQCEFRDITCLSFCECLCHYAVQVLSVPCLSPCFAFLT